ncbi:RNA polymerase sigma factor [Aquimarina sp. Aq107]|uniref:RNA polymerase sigma factor n=1 Tax=Aquimarina sp. Aq107 TaxID=1191912 RepID=UPI00131EF7CF|nr:sigma-70 family RNA polymerase sigma factor [Aquimarina sp. Aq107]
MNTTKNQQIIDGIIAGDSMILKSFYKKNLPPVRKLIRQYQGTAEDVEDIFQEALVLLYHKLRSGNIELPISSIETYFIGICKNLWRNKLRKQRRIEHQEINEKNLADTSDSILIGITKEHQLDIFHKHLNNLSNSSKNVLNLFFEGKSMKDIASSTGYTEGYTRKKKCIIKERLYKMVQNDPVYKELVA